MRRTFTLVLALLLCVNLIYSQNQRIVCDETCKIEAGFDTAQSKSGGNYAVVSPVGRSSVKMIQQAPRLETLEGKTIAIVGESFMTHVTHPELKRLILKNYPTAKVILLDEIGEAGPFPAPGVTRQRKEEFEAKLKSMHVDAVIAGNGGCGLCTPKETGSCLTAEYIGIPSVIIAGPGFADQAYYTAYNNGVPVMRVEGVRMQNGGVDTYCPDTVTTYCSRYMMLEDSTYLTLRTSARATFAGELLPAGRCNLKGILVNSSSGPLLYLRSLEDVEVQ